MVTKRLGISLLSVCALLPLASPTAAVEKAVTFVFQPVIEGQQITQQVSVRTNATRTFEQSEQIISSSDYHIRNDQIRHITVLDANPQHSARIKVKYARAIVKVGKGLTAKSQPQPVAEKSYIVTRVDGELQVTDLQGSTPPETELDIVRSNMQWVGQANPLAQFLNGRTLMLGESLQLPRHLAADLFGGTNRLGKVDRVTLTLRRIRRVRGRECGVFDAALIGESPAGDTPNVWIRGDIAVEIATCRSMDTKMDATLDAKEQRGPAGATFTVGNRGKVRIAIEVTYNDRLF
jgi:hypothetical protein